MSKAILAHDLGIAGVSALGQSEQSEDFVSKKRTLKFG